MHGMWRSREEKEKKAEEEKQAVANLDYLFENEVTKNQDQVKTNNSLI